MTIQHIREQLDSLENNRLTTLLDCQMRSWRARNNKLKPNFSGCEKAGIEYAKQSGITKTSFYDDRELTWSYCIEIDGERHWDCSPDFEEYNELFWDYVREGQEIDKARVKREFKVKICQDPTELELLEDAKADAKMNGGRVSPILDRIWGLI